MTDDDNGDTSQTCGLYPVTEWSGVSHGTPDVLR